MFQRNRHLLSSQVILIRRTDPNHDGLYEDINGNGILDFNDVVAYYDNIDWIVENMQLEFFDYNKNGLIEFDDVVMLYDML